MPPWVWIIIKIIWIVGGVVAIVATVLGICITTGVFGGDSDADRLTNEQAEAAKRSVDENRQTQGVVESKTVETPVNDLVSNEVTESSAWTLTNAAKLVATGITGYGIYNWFSGAESKTPVKDPTNDGTSDKDPTSDVTSDKDPTSDGTPGDSTGWVSNLLTMVTENPLVSLGSIVLLGGIYIGYKKLFGLRAGWEKCYDKNGHAYYYNSQTNESHWDYPKDEDEDRHVSRAYIGAMGNSALGAKVTANSTFEGEATIVSGIMTFSHEHLLLADQHFVAVALPADRGVHGQIRTIDVLVSDLDRMRMPWWDSSLVGTFVLHSDPTKRSCITIQEEPRVLLQGEIQELLSKDNNGQDTTTTFFSPTVIAVIALSSLAGWYRYF